MISLEDRLKRLEQYIAELADALDREGTELDGNWGHTSSHAIYARIAEKLKKARDS